MSVYDIDFWCKSKIDYSVEFVRAFGESMKRANPDDKLYVCFSGGKDSVVLAEIVKRSGVPYELHYNITGLDYPETVRFIRNFGGVIMHQHEKSFFQLLKQQKILPTRQVRFCCAELKERGGANRFVLTGVRGKNGLIFG
jgi:phosphoadenosine phosphosulfate reductase